MSFFDAVVSGFKNCFVFRGRSSRSEFWWFFLFSIMACLIALNFSFENLNKELSKSDINDVSSVLRTLLSSWFGVALLITYVPQIALSVRRFHDINKSGWWFFGLQIVPSVLPQALSFIGIITLFAYLYFMCEKGGDENQYGSNPLKDKESV